jgi:hypothetical protein
VACNLHKIATVNLRDLEAALDLIGEMAMPVPTNHAQDYLDTISDSGILNNSIRDLILTAFEVGWKEHEQWISDDPSSYMNPHDEGTSYCTSLPDNAIHDHTGIHTG